MKKHEPLVNINLKKAYVSKRASAEPLRQANSLTPRCKAHSATKMLSSMSYSASASKCHTLHRPQRSVVHPAPLHHGMRARCLTVTAARPMPHQPNLASIQEDLPATPTQPRTTGPGMSNILPFPRTSPQLPGLLHRPVAAPQHAFELDSQGVERLKLEPDGWNSWEWRGHKINWVAAGRLVCGWAGLEGRPLKRAVTLGTCGLAAKQLWSDECCFGCHV